jgi:iron complex transport system substrate-binding protein
MALNPQSLADVLVDIEALGLVTGATAQATLLRANLTARIDAVRSATADLPADRRPRAALVEWLDPLMLSGNWMPEMVELAGGRHDLTQSGRHSPYVSWDDLAAYDPQVVLVLPCGFDLDRTLGEWRILAEQPLWTRLSAVRSGRVFAVDGNRDWSTAWRSSPTSYIPIASASRRI